MRSESLIPKTKISIRTVANTTGGSPYPKDQEVKMGIRESYRRVYILLDCGADGNPHRITMEIRGNRHSGPDKAGAAATTYRNGNRAHQARLHKPDVWTGRECHNGQLL